MPLRDSVARTRSAVVSSATSTSTSRAPRATIAAARASACTSATRQQGIFAPPRASEGEPWGASTRAPSFETIARSSLPSRPAYENVPPSKPTANASPLGGRARKRCVAVVSSPRPQPAASSAASGSDSFTGWPRATSACALSSHAARRSRSSGRSANWAAQGCSGGSSFDAPRSLLGSRSPGDASPSRPATVAMRRPGHPAPSRPRRASSSWIARAVAVDRATTSTSRPALVAGRRESVQRMARMVSATRVPEGSIEMRARWLVANTADGRETWLIHASAVPINVPLLAPPS